MIEPIDFGGALRRSWRLLLVCAVVFAIVAVLIPVGSSKPKDKNRLKWEATAVVGDLGGDLGSGKTSAPALLMYWANEYTVKQATIQNASIQSPAPDWLLTASLGASVGFLSTTGGVSSGRPNKPPKITPQSVITLVAGGTSAKNAVNLVGVYAITLQAKAQAEADAIAQAQAQANTKSGSGSSSAAAATASGGSGNSGFQVINPPTPRKTPSASKASIGASRKVRLGAGLVIGLLIGAAIVLIRELLDKRIHTAGRAERTFKYPVVAEISDRLGVNGQAHSANVLEVVEAPTSAPAEAYRMLRMSVLFEELATAPPAALDPFNDGVSSWQDNRQSEYKAPEPGSRQLILVVSASDEESRPKVAANLSATYAEAGQHVIVISTGDIAPARAGMRVNGSSPVGPDDVTANLVPSQLPHVSRLSLRPFVGNASQLVTHAPAVLDAARQVADVVIVESPPLLTSHHGEALVHAVDVVLVVGECAKTTMSEARRAGDLLRRLGAPVLGVVLTKVRPTPRELRRASRLAKMGQPKADGTPERALADPQVVPEISPPVPESSQA